MKERTRLPISGGLMLLVGLAILGSAAYFAQRGLRLANADLAMHTASSSVLSSFAIALTCGVAGLLVLKGLFVQAPNEARVLQFFGSYVGTLRTEGLRWTSPFNTRRAISLRVRTFETEKIKVNDVDGNPIEIAAIVQWRVVDTANACFEVENYVDFVQLQAESAVRNFASHHPYDTHDESKLSLRGQPELIASHLQNEISKRVQTAGVEVVEARIAHLAYAQEIAQAMLQRQQAGAIIGARKLIVEGAVSIVEMALQQLSSRGVVELDAERKAAMVSNLLVVLCGERSTQPVINAGTLY